MRPEENGDTLLRANKDLVRRLIEEVWNQGQAGRVPEFWSGPADGAAPAPDGEPSTLAEVAALHQRLTDAFPDLRITIDDMIAEGDRVATRLTFRGTHRGSFRGIGPTGRAVEFTASRVYRIADGKVTQTWATVDVFGLVEQLRA